MDSIFKKAVETKVSEGNFIKEPPENSTIKIPNTDLGKTYTLESLEQIVEYGETEKLKINWDEFLEYNTPIQNKQDGLEREAQVEEELKQEYPEEEGYSVESEVYLRDENGDIVKDPESGEARRIDFVITKDGEVVDSVEVTSETADKTKQLEKEERIRDEGGNYIKDSDGNLVHIPDNVHTRVERKA